QQANINLYIRTKGSLFGLLWSYTPLELSEKYGHRELSRILRNSNRPRRNNPKQFNYKAFLSKHDKCNYYLPPVLAQGPGLGTLKSENLTAWDGFATLCKDIERAKNVSQRLLVFNGEPLSEQQISDIEDFYHETSREYMNAGKNVLETILLKTLEIPDSPLACLCKLLTVTGVKQLLFTYCQRFSGQASNYIAQSASELLKDKIDNHEDFFPIPQTNTVTNIEFMESEGRLNVILLADSLQWTNPDPTLSQTPKISFIENPIISINLKLQTQYAGSNKYEFDVIAKTNHIHIANSFFRSFIKDRMQKLAKSLTPSNSETKITQEKIQNLFLESYRYLYAFDTLDQEELTQLLKQLTESENQPELIKLIDQFAINKYEKYFSSKLSVIKKEEKYSVSDSPKSELPIKIRGEKHQVPNSPKAEINEKKQNPCDQSPLIKLKKQLHAFMHHQNSRDSFIVERPKNDCMQLRFTAADQIGVKPELSQLLQLFKQALADKIKAQKYRIGINDKNWKVTIYAEPSTLDQVYQLLVNLGVSSLFSPAKTQASLF
ncbi:MAG: hypothetical protein JSR33_11420, partial [Proteobacteria bacterium]|nr:hypothetical protein [Pseudomonadota bacterium]